MESTVIQQMVDNIIAGRDADAITDFQTAMADKVTAALDVRKMDIASSLGKTTEEETEDENVQ